MISTPERGFEHPFCQLLIGEGHEIVHIDSHSAREDGKDIISLSMDGKLFGYQLKSGNIDVSRWRSEVEPELRELAEYPIHHPKYDGRYCAGILVTTGTLNEPALHKLTEFNKSVVTRGVGTPVQLFDRHVLLERFLRCEDVVLPADLEGTRSFLHFVLADGKEPLDIKKFATFVDDLIPPPDVKSVRSGEARRLVAACLLVVNHALASSTQAENHHVIMEGWTIAAARIARAAIQHGWAPELWMPSFNLAVLTARVSLGAMEAEALKNDGMLSGTPWGDGGVIWRTRATLVAGSIAANRLCCRLEQESTNESQAVAMVESLRPHLLMWGESSVPYFLAMYWFLREFADKTFREESYLSMSVLRSIAEANGTGKRSLDLPSPYYRAEECIRRILIPKSINIDDEDFRSSSYFSLPLIAILLVAMRRQALKSIWHDVVVLNNYYIDELNDVDFLRYRSTGGVLKNKHFPRPTSWWELAVEIEQARRDAANKLPRIIVNNPVFAILFFLVHPHRLNLSAALWLNEKLKRQ